MGKNKPQINADELQLEIDRLLRELSHYKQLEVQFNETLHDLHVHQEELRTQNEDLIHAHREIADAHEKYLDLFDHAPIGYFLLDQNGIITEINLAAADLLGRTRRQLLGKPLWLYLEKSHTDLFRAHLRSIWEGRPAFLETTFLRHENEQVIVEMHSIPPRSKDKLGATCRIAVIDATRRESAEKALRNTNQWLDSIIETIPDIVYRLNPDGNIEFINNAVRKYGYDPEELLNKHYLTIVSPEDRNQAKYRMNERRIGDRHTRDLEIRLLTRTVESSEANGADTIEPIFSINASGLYQEDEKGTNRLIGTQGIAHDITSRKQREQEQLQLKEQLQQARRMEAIGTLAGGVAHDFNNIMTGIQGSASLLQLMHPESQKTQDLLAVIEQGINRGKDLTGQLLGYARGGKYVVKPTNLNLLLASSLNLFNPIQKKIEIVKSFAPDLWSVQADRGQMEQIFLNLFINAGQAMPAGGILQLRTNNELIDNQEARRRDIAAGNFVRVAVEDSGVGMDAETCAHIFEPFFTTKSKGDGTGLGLASVYGIVRNHEGSIEVTSILGQGTTFDILLPACPDEKEPVRQSKKTPVTMGQGTILVVDDEQVISDMLTEILSILGYTVKTASSGKSALEIYQADFSRIDLVILDILMPGLSGLETYDLLKEINPAINVVFSSGYSSDESIEQILRTDNQHFLQKPFAVAELSALVDKLI